MAYARVSYEGDASTTIFTVPFPYLDTSHVEVRVAGVLKTVTTHYTWLTSSTIQFVTAPASGATVYVLRNTPKEERLVDFQDAAILRESDLDLDSNQSFYIAQEVLDAALNTQAVETFVGGTDYTAGVTTTLTIGSTEVEESGLTVLFDAAAQHQTEYSVASGVITFNSAIPVGVAQVQVTYAVPLALGLQEGSVTSPKIADLNVTTDKLANLSVTTGKLANESVTEPKLAQAVFNDLTAVAPALGDYLALSDVSNSGNKAKALVSAILALIQSATTSVRGGVVLATSTEGRAAVEATKALTSACLDWPRVFSGSGYQQLPGTPGLVVQWGVSGSMGLDANTTLTLPITFTGGAMIAFSSMLNATTANDDCVSRVISLTTTQITLRCENIGTSNTGTRYINYLAIGHT